jgi:hypothetical protein
MKKLTTNEKKLKFRFFKSKIIICYEKIRDSWWKTLIKWEKIKISSIKEYIVFLKKIYC